MRIIVAMILLSVPLWASGNDAKDALDHFRFFTRCAPVQLVIESVDSDAEKIGLTDEDIQVALESRFRSARIYTDAETNNWLSINILVDGNAFNIILQFNKLVFDPITQNSGFAVTWSTGAAGTHGSDAGFILSSLSGHIDRFLVGYLRVNEPDCNS